MPLIHQGEVRVESVRSLESHATEERVASAARELVATAPAKPAGVTVPGAASAALLPLLQGPPRPVSVAVVGRTAAFLTTGDAAIPAVALLHRTAVRLPNGLLLAGGPGARFQHLAPGDPALLGDGRVRCAGLVVVPARWWSPGPRPGFLPRTAAARVDELDRLLAGAPPLPDYLVGPVARFGATLRDRRPQVAAAAALELLGLGGGLTPSGDDVVAGALVAVRAADADPGLAAAASAVAAAVTGCGPGRTTLVSAALLCHAAVGHCIPELTGLLAALTTGGGLRRPLAALRAVGHTSGCDLARGVALALAALTGKRLATTWEDRT